MFFFKQKTAYEMRISDWSSDVCSSDLAGRAAELNRPVLVIGERGTGKELIAERLHRLSPRWGEPLVTTNCAALPETLIAAELFGHEAGAFTGATKARVGRFGDARKRVVGGNKCERTCRTRGWPFN